MVDLEPSKEGLKVLLFRVALLDAVVARHYDPLWSDLEVGTFRLSFEGVVISPLLQVVSSDLLRTHLLDDDRFLSLVAVPPDVVGLDVGVRVSLPNTSRLPGSSDAPMPLVGQRVNRLSVLLHNLEEVEGLLQLTELLDWHETFRHRLQWSILENHLVTGLSVSLDVLSRGWDSMLKRTL